MKVSFSPDIILCGWLGLNHQLTNSLFVENLTAFSTYRPHQSKTWFSKLSALLIRRRRGMTLQPNALLQTSDECDQQRSIHFWALKHWTHSCDPRQKTKWTISCACAGGAPTGCSEVRRGEQAPGSSITGDSWKHGTSTDLQSTSSNSLGLLSSTYTMHATRLT